MYGDTFEEKGCRILKRSLTPEQADKHYNELCYICCSHGLSIKCEACKISATYDKLMLERWGKKVKQSDGT